jgi:hypothetical protein
MEFINMSLEDALELMYLPSSGFGLLPLAAAYSQRQNNHQPMEKSEWNLGLQTHEVCMVTM